MLYVSDQHQLGHVLFFFHHLSGEGCYILSVVPPVHSPVLACVRSARPQHLNSKCQIAVGSLEPQPHNTSPTHLTTQQTHNHKHNHKHTTHNIQPTKHNHKHNTQPQSHNTQPTAHDQQHKNTTTNNSTNTQHITSQNRAPTQMQYTTNKTQPQTQ